MADDDTGSTGGKTFTQSEVDAIVRDRLRREREQTATKYADYDDLRKQAEDGNKSKTQLDRMAEQLAKLEERAVKAEGAQLRAEVARELGLTDRQARRLSGKTREELLADGRDMLEDFAPKSGDKGGKETEGDDGNGDEGGKATSGDAGRTETGKQDTGTAAARRPKETLTSGAPMTGAKPEETDPLKLAELIPRR